jgi:SOS response associated peptidase (SRAP)
MSDVFLGADPEHIASRILTAGSEAAGAPVVVRVGDEGEGSRNIGVDLPPYKPGVKARYSREVLRRVVAMAIERAGVTLYEDQRAPKVAGQIKGRVKVREIERRPRIVPASFPGTPIAPRSAEPAGASVAQAAARAESAPATPRATPSTSPPARYAPPAMCARYTLTRTELGQVIAELAAELDASAEAIRLPRYNVAPAQACVIAVRGAAAPVLTAATWGLRLGGRPAVNLRYETAGGIPGLRRCLVPADGFYEWTGEKSCRRPIWFHRPAREAAPARRLAPAGHRRAAHLRGVDRPGAAADEHDPRSDADPARPRARPAMARRRRPAGERGARIGGDERIDAGERHHERRRGLDREERARPPTRG